MANSNFNRRAALAGIARLEPVEVMPGVKAVDPPDVVSDVPEVAPASRLAEIADAARGVMRASIRDLGILLREEKSLCPHGKFEGWAQRELGISPRSAENYMAAARFLEGKSEKFAHLPASVIYRLAAPSAPHELVEDVEAGLLDLSEIKEKLTAADNARRHAEWIARTQARGQKRRRATHHDPIAAKRVEGPARGERDLRAELAALAARIAESGLAQALIEVLSNDEKASALANILRERL